MRQQELQATIVKLIREDKIQEAMDLIFENFEDSEDLDEIIIQNNRYNRLLKDKRIGTISAAEIRKELSTLELNILAFVRKEMQPTQKRGKIKYSLKDFRTNLEFSMVRVKVSQLLLKSYRKNEYLPISAIYKLTERKNRALLIEFLRELEQFNLIEKKRAQKLTHWKLKAEGEDYLSKWMGDSKYVPY